MPESNGTCKISKVLAFRILRTQENVPANTAEQSTNSHRILGTKITAPKLEPIFELDL